MDIDFENSYFQWKSLLRYEPIVPGQQHQSPAPVPTPVQSVQSVQAPTYNTNVDYRLIHTDKIFLPSSALEDLVKRASDTRPLPSPLTFKVTNVSNKKFTYVGVREFSAPENIINIPVTVAKELDLEENSHVAVEFHHLNKGTAVTLQLLQDDNNGTDWKHLLEHRLHGSYTTLVKGRHISVIDPKDSQSYSMVVSDLKPDDAVCIVDTDVDLDIVPPLETVNKKQDQPPIETGPVELKADGSVFELDNASPGVELKFLVKGWDRQEDIEVVTGNPLTDIVVAGTDEYSTSSTSFIWSNVDSLGSPLIIKAQDTAVKPDSGLYIIACPSTKTFSIQLSTNTSRSSTEHINDAAKHTLELKQSPAAGYRVCENCGQTVSEQSFMLHSSFCLRNNSVCPDGCGLVFNKREGLPEGHWHCHMCSPQLVYGDSFVSKQMHDRMLHEKQTCECGREFANGLLLGKHRALECPNGLHVCMFCHLRLPREVATPQDAIQGLTGHESYCGNRTVDCEICKRSVRLRDVESHMGFHDMDRRQAVFPTLCHNVNCVHIINSDDLASRKGLCGTCFAPLHSTVYDPTGTKLTQRIERRYVLQLTRGCGKPWCMNQYCVTADPTLKKKGMAAAMQTTRELMSNDSTEFYFCVDEARTKRKMFVDFESEQTDYSREWCAKAIQETRGNESEARSWLQLHAVKRSEQ